MAPGAPRDKRKVARGGGKKFSRGMRETGGDLDISEVPSSIITGSDAESSSEEEASGSESESGANASSEPMSRAERKAAAKARKEAAAARTKAMGGASGGEEDGEEDAPVAAIKKGVAGLKVANPNDPVNAARAGPSRREREAMEAQAAKERYWKLQQEGKTDQAKADLARLAKIRAEREAAAAARKAEIEERKAAAEKKAAERGGRR